MFETAMIWVLAIAGGYLALSFIVSVLLIGCGYYFVWRLTK